MAPEAPLFHAEWNLWGRDERSSKRLGRRTVAKIIRQAARLSGISQWALITPHTLRKAFESVLRSPTVDGNRMDIATQQFFFGHILPGSQDTYYDKGKTDFHRPEYEKLNFFEPPATRSTDKLISSKELEKHLNEGWMFIA
jgi:integrase